MYFLNFQIYWLTPVSELTLDIHGNINKANVLRINIYTIIGTMAALSVMINLELPHVNVLSKIDLLSKTARKHLDR